MVPKQTGVLDIEAAGDVVGRNMEHRGAPTPLLPLDRQNMQDQHAARISNMIRPQDLGGGAAQIATPRGVVDMEVTNLPELSVVEPQSVPSRILVVLVEEASMTVCEDSYISPCVEETLSSSDLAGRLCPVVPAGIPFPVGPVGPISPLSPSDSESVGPDGPYRTLSPSVSESVGPDGLYGTLSPSANVAVGPVGLYGALSPFNPDSVGPVGPCGTLSRLILLQ